MIGTNRWPTRSWENDPAGRMGPRGCDPLASRWRARLPSVAGDFAAPTVTSFTLAAAVPQKVANFDAWRHVLIITADVGLNLVVVVSPSPELTGFRYAFKLAGKSNTGSGAVGVFGSGVEPYVQIDFTAKGGLSQSEWWAMLKNGPGTATVNVTEQRYMG